mgnify:CR=1 FL=1
MSSNESTNNNKQIESETDENTSISNEYTAHNLLVAGIISTIYVLLISKFAEVMSSTDENDQEVGQKQSVGTYVMIIYFISIIGIVFSYLYFKEDNVPDFIMKWSLNIGGILVLMYTVVNYWNYLDDYAKCTLLISTFVSIVYYLYKIY